jgi:single-strand DNA-binding protein
LLSKLQKNSAFKKSYFLNITNNPKSLQTQGEIMSINKVILVGNVGQDPEIRSTQDGREIANFSLATSDSWKDKSSGERKEKTEWHRVVIFSQGLINVVRNYIKKGSKLYIEGSLQTRKWTDSQGVEKFTTEVVLQNFNSTLQILDARERNSSYGGSDSSSSSHSGGGHHKQRNNDVSVEENDDEIPF